jgi:PHP family Zn ribbon phosphoesterase
VTVTADLHIHSCLSPCGDLDNSPSAIARTARSRRLDLVALTDHNSALNCPAFAEACEREGVAALFGLEVTTAEEVHVLCLFAECAAALELGERLYPLLPEVHHDPATFGDQVYVDVDEVILGSVEKYLINAVSWSIDETARECHAREGIFIPAHIDRSVHSIWSQLGFLPTGDFDAVEVTRRNGPIDSGTYATVSNSDAHFLPDIASRSFTFEADAPTFAALRAALASGATTLRL